MDTNQKNFWGASGGMINRELSLNPRYEAYIHGAGSESHPRNEQTKVWCREKVEDVKGAQGR